MRRRALLTAATLTALPARARGARSAAPAAVSAAPSPASVTPSLIEAARKEGKVAYYTSSDLTLAVALSKRFEAKYPGISVQLERSGAERNFQRISQEYASGVRVADVVSSSDLGYLLIWKKTAWLTPYVAEEAMRFPEGAVEPDGFYTREAFSLMIPAYHGKMVGAEDVPKTWNDLLDPKWKGKMVKAHPGYSGNITTGTFALVRALGWEFFEKLAKQQVMQVQSAGDPALRVAQGERVIAADGSENAIWRVAAKGAPVMPVYPAEGSPVVPTGIGLMTAAPHPNAARLLLHFVLSAEGQSTIAGFGSRAVLPGIPVPPGLRAAADLRLLHSDPAEVAVESEAIRKRYTKLFGI